MAKKKTTEKALNIDNILFNCRDYLRAARNSGSFFEKRDMMLTLVFLRFIGEKYEDGIENLKQTLKEQGLDPEDENIRAAFFDDATFADGTYNLPPEARWSTIISTPAPQLNVALDTALQPEIVNTGDNYKILKNKYGDVFGWNDMTAEQLTEAWKNAKATDMFTICKDLASGELEGFQMPKHIQDVIDFLSQESEEVL